MEAYVNYVADAFAKAGTLERHEACFINDKVLVFDEKKCLVVERIAFHSIEDKVKVLMRRFAPTYDFKSPTWCRFVECKGVRNQLVHPRNDEDDTDLATYDSHVTDGLSCTLQIMNALSGAIFQKPLRKQLLDLVP
jgi:hypothetical protein